MYIDFDYKFATKNKQNFKKKNKKQKERVKVSHPTDIIFSIQIYYFTVYLNFDFFTQSTQ
jgi:hypothetical protein